MTIVAALVSSFVQRKVWSGENERGVYGRDVRSTVEGYGMRGGDHATPPPPVACASFVLASGAVADYCIYRSRVRLSCCGLIVGRYMAPEVALGKPYNGAADVYGEIGLVG